MSEFETLAVRIMEYLKANHHPHTSIIADSNHVELVEGLQCVNSEEEYDEEPVF